MAIDYKIKKEAVLASNSIEELKRSSSMPPVPKCDDDQNFVFISYSHKDYKAVYCDLLEFHNNGLRYWYDEGLPAGEDWDKVVESRIKNPKCSGVIFYMSENLFLSRSVNREIEFTVSGGDDGGGAKNYFCINLSDMPPLKIIFSIQKNREYDELEQSGFIDCLPCLTSAFSNKSTYIPKRDEADSAHIQQTLKQIQDRFGVFIDGRPIANDEEAEKLAKELEYAKNFAIKDGIFLRYMGKGREVLIPDGIKSIGDSAFAGCDHVVRVVIPDGVRSIGKEAFRGCGNLKSCNIPDSVTDIGENAFAGCSQLIKDDFGARYVDNWLVGFRKFFSSDILTEECSDLFGTRGIAAGVLSNFEGLARVKLGNGVKYINARAFQNAKALTGAEILDGVSGIGEGAFYGCSAMTEISLPESVTEIKKSAFYGCTGLAQIKIPSAVTDLSECMLSGCTGLASVEIPDGVTKIGCAALQGCKGIAELVVPDSVSVIDNYAFNACSGLRSVTVGSGVKRIGYDAFSSCGALETVNITDIGAWCNISFAEAASNPLRVAKKLCIDGEPITSLVVPDGVTAIKNYAFSCCEGLTEVVIPDSVVSIGDSAFSDCTALCRVVMGSCVKSIGKDAFYGCKNLTEIVIPDGVSFIRENTFSDCGALTSVTIGGRVEIIGERAFSGCKSLLDVAISDSVTAIRAGAFQGCRSLTKLAVPDSVEIIERDAFLGCSALSDVAFGKNLRIISGMAFSECPAISQIKADFANNTFHSIDNCLVLTAEKKLVLGCKNSIIPNDGSVASIGEWAFSSCAGLKSIDVPESISSIERYAFSFNDISAITLPSSIASIRMNFTACHNLSFNEYGNACYLGNAENPYLVLARAKDEYISDCTVHSDTKIICCHAFSGCSNLVRIDIPEGVISIGENAFDYCYSLFDITVPESVESIGSHAFRKCISLKKITLPEGISQIEADLFCDCTALTEIVIPDSVVRIEKRAFYGCTSLSTIRIPSRVREIGEAAFSGCRALTEILLPDGIGEIRSNMFSGCSSLTDFSMPSNVFSVGTNAFLGCASMKFNGYDNALYLGNANNPYLVLVWATGEFITDCKIHPDTRIICADAFEKCADIEMIELPDGVTEIGEGAFKHCKSMESINIPAGVTRIEKCTFTGCASLKKIIISDSVEYIGELAFSICTAITEIAIPDSVTCVEKDAFIGCSSLKKITVGNSVERIGSSAFERCSALDSLYIKDLAAWCKIDFRSVLSNPMAYAKKIYVDGKNVTDIVIPDGVCNIGFAAFANFSGLKSVRLPRSVESIKTIAFGNCSGLETIIFEGSSEEWSLVRKQEGWDMQSDNYTLRCADSRLGKPEGDSH